MFENRYRVEISSNKGMQSSEQTAFESNLRTRDEIADVCKRYRVTAIVYGPERGGNAIAVVASNGHWVELVEGA